MELDTAVVNRLSVTDSDLAASMKALGTANLYIV